MDDDEAPVLVAQHTLPSAWRAHAECDVVLPLARGGADINAKDELIAGLLRAPPHVRDIQRHGRVAQALIAEQSGIKVLVKAMRAHETHAVSVQ